MAFDLAKFLTRFIEEAREHCARLNDGLLKLESSPGDGELLNALFRSAHTIKGSARMMKLTGINELAHRMEDVLDALRGGGLVPRPELSDLLFKGVDAVGVMLAEVEVGNKQVEAPEELCGALSRAVAGEEGAAVAKPAPAPPKPQAPAPPAPAQGTPVKAKMSDYLRVNSDKLDELVGLMGEIVSEHGKLKDHLAHLRELERRLPATEAEPGDGGGGWRREWRHGLAAMDDDFHLEEQLIVALQNSALKLRMQPLTTIFDPLRRTVRDLARERGREVDFVVEGGDTELDRKIIERIGDSLMHMIRNALDHGMENPAEREAVAKPTKGTIRLLAEYDSAGVCITLEDDGRGIALDKVKEKALAKKLVAPEIMAAMSEAEITNLIFLPGFSTSPIITDLSGRGVGMDVVRKNIVDELRGSVVIKSREGRGTTITLRLPLNLAVFSLFLVRVGEQLLALSATSLVEIISVPPTEIIKIVTTSAIRLRNQLISVSELAELVAVARAGTPEAANAVTLIIVRDGQEKLGLIVDEVIGREEMVVKPLPVHMRGLRLLAGLTLGARDRIITVLHGPELIRRARAGGGRTAPRPAQETEVKRHSVLVVDDSFNTRELEKGILEAYGYEVVTAEDGEDALEKIAAVQYDLVVTDIEMPRLDGFSLTERLRGDERYREIPIVIVTSREKDEDKKRGIAVGADAYIVKGSFDQSNLLDTVRSLLG